MKNPYEFPCANGTGKFSTASDHHLQPKAIPSKRIVLKLKKTTKKFQWRSVVHERWIYLPTSWRTSNEAVRPTWENIPDSIEIRQRDETHKKTDMLDNVSHNSFTDRTEAKGFNLSEDWIGTTRLQILRTTLQGFEWDQGRPSIIHKTTRPDNICLKLDTMIQETRTK